jgi:CRISPR-associated protein Cas1
VALKLRSQSRFLRQALQRRPDCRKPLWDGIEQIQRACAGIGRAEEGASTVQRLRGIEGAAAASYFSAFAPLFPADLAFAGRNRRPPKDPVNAALSLGYTLLHFEAVNACHAAGLDPYVGFYHEPAYHRESLAADLIEPLRASVDAWVWRLFAERDLRGESFVQEEGGCLLKKHGREVFYARYELFIRPLRCRLRRHCLLIARRLAGDR